MGQLAIRSPAKLNLCLRVLGERPDGYHDIDSVMIMADLCDELLFDEISSGVEIVCDHPDVPSDDRNLACRAAAALISGCAIGRGVRIEISKKIAVAAGLGGGSSNAAATLIALNEMWGIGLGREELMAYALRLGSDVPFFLFWHAARASGRGEILQRVSPSRCLPLLIVCPPAQIPTKWAYEKLKIDLTEPVDEPRIIAKSLELGDLATVGKHLKNDLEEPVRSRVSAVDGLKAELLRLGALGSAMSGSGPSVFGLFGEEGLCVEAEKQLRGRGWKLYRAGSFASLEEAYWGGEKRKASI